jgi:hypothetical protein
MTILSKEGFRAARTANNQKIFELLNWCRENMCTPDGKRVCLLCARELSGDPRGVLGHWEANEEAQKRIGAPPGKTRIILYMLCEGCYELPDVVEIVDKKLLASLSVQ